MSVFFATALVAALLGIAVYAAFVSFRRVMRHDGRLRLVEAAHLHGLDLPQPQSDSAAYNAGLAAFRCVSCRHTGRCDELLAARDWRALRGICPNGGYIERLKRGEQSFF